MHPLFNMMVPTKKVMRAAVLVEPGKIEIAQVPIPEPGSKEVRVRIESCGVCASNLAPWEGRPWFKYPMEPGALGHEAIGVVDLPGPDADEWMPGQRVAILSSKAYAEYDVAKSEALVPLPDDFKSDAFPAEVVGCAMNIFRRAAIRPGDLVAIVGVGFLGSLLIQLARNIGARVIAFARREYALQIATQLGAEPIAWTDHHEALSQFLAITQGNLCDVVIEAVGKQSALDLGAELTRERGRLVIAGYHQDGSRQINLQLWNWRGLDVINAHERETQVYMHGISGAIEAVQEGKLNVSPLVTHHFPLEQLSEALRLTAERPDGFMKAVVLP